MFKIKVVRHLRLVVIYFYPGWELTINLCNKVTFFHCMRIIYHGSENLSYLPIGWNRITTELKQELSLKGYEELKKYDNLDTAFAC